MARRLTLFLVLALALAACGLGVENTGSTGTERPVFDPSPFEASGQTAETATRSSETASSSVEPATDTPGPDDTPSTTVENPAATTAGADRPATATPTETPTETPPPTPSVIDLSLQAENISFYPIPAIYDGDLVSFEVKPVLPADLPPNDVDVRVLVDGEEAVSGNINYRNLSGEAFGLYQWVWDASDQVGPHEVTAIVDPDDLIQLGDEDPDNNEASTVFLVRPNGMLPDSAIEATWITAESQCCTVHFISGTAAQRDLEDLLTELDDAFQLASARLDEPLSDDYQVYFIDRVIGQGGYATDYMVVSYLDRDYGSGNLRELLIHEATHLIDLSFAPDRLSFLAEGMAVWVAGGHYQQEDLGRKMAGLVEMGRHAPLEELLNDFHDRQHETSYLEAGAFVSFLINRYGWPRVRAFYSATTPDDGVTLAAALEFNLNAHFGLSLEQMEEAWLDYLEDLPRDRGAADNIRANIRFFEVVRRYQRELDPSAFYLTAWLPPPAEGERLGATADFSRRPQASANIALETMLQRAGQLMLEGQYDLMNALLDSVVRVLGNDGRFLDPLARSYLDIVLTIREMDYEAHSIAVSGNLAQVFASPIGETALHQFYLTLQGDHTWVLAR